MNQQLVVYYSEQASIPFRYLEIFAFSCEQRAGFGGSIHVVNLCLREYPVYLFVQMRIRLLASQRNTNNRWIFLLNRQQ